jgi:hypothetical protein
MIPFGMWPGSWGLKGKTREIAQAEYELTGYDLEVKLAEINHREDEVAFKKTVLAIDLNYGKVDDYNYDLGMINLTNTPNSTVWKQNKLDLDRKYNKIDEYTYDHSVAELVEPAKDRQLALASVEFKHEKITENEYERRRADILEEPWIAMPKIAWDPEDSSKTYFELDYNEAFINYLRENNYQGSDDDCINRWLNDICFSVIEDLNQPEPELVSTIRKIRLPDGKTEHS